MKKFGETAGFSAKQLERIKNILGGQSFEWENLVVPRCPVNKDQAVVGTPHGHSVTKSNINMDFVQIAIKCTVNGTTPL